MADKKYDKVDTDPETKTPAQSTHLMKQCDKEVCVFQNKLASKSKLQRYNQENRNHKLSRARKCNTSNR